MVDISENKKIKIMHVVECGGGVERYLKSFLKYIDMEKFDNILVLSERYKKETYEKYTKNIEIITIRHKIGPHLIFSALKIRKLINKYKPDIVYAHSSVAGFVARVANVWKKNACVYNPHGWSFNMQEKKSKVFLCVERIMAHFCDLIICISGAEWESAITNKICKEDKLYLIYNGIDFDEYTKNEIDRNKMDVPLKAYVIGMVGRISKQKATDIFVKMAGEINRKLENTYYIIVGDIIEGAETEKQQLLELAEKLGIKLKITGWVDNPIDYIKIFDVACLLSRWEGFGLVLPEYMMCGKPIVASNVDAIPYLIENKVNGVLVDVDDYKAAANEVINIINNTSFRDKLSNNARMMVKEKFDVKRVVREHEKIFTDIMKKNGRNI